jgi:hypothetical protein
MIFCTGNPAHQGVASGINATVSDVDFGCRETGYDFTTTTGLEKFQRNIINYDTFVNSSFIASEVQITLLELAHRAWMQADVKGHVISLGSTIEWADTTEHAQYAKSKRDLRKRSLELNDLTGITGVKTTYIIVGGINDGKSGHEHYLNTTAIANAVVWTIKNPNRIALLQIESAKFQTNC